MKKSDLVVYRLPVPEDIPFIFATWLKGLRFSSAEHKAVPSQQFFRARHKIIESVLLRKDVVVNVACLKEDTNTILGYSVTENNTVHWVFVKKRWRGIGLGSDLLPITIEKVTATTKQVSARLKEFPLIKVELI